MFKPVEEEFAGLLMAIAEFAHHVFEKEVDFGLGQRHDAGDDPLDAVLARRLERTDDDPAVVRFQDNARSLDVERASCLIGAPRMSVIVPLESTPWYRPLVFSLFASMEALTSVSREA